jgi:hypothetical protein
VEIELNILYYDTGVIYMSDWDEVNQMSLKYHSDMTKQEIFAHIDERSNSTEASKILFVVGEFKESIGDEKD